MKVASIFAGIGGFCLGFERAGFNIVKQVEIDRFCLDLLGLRFPDVKKEKDIRYAQAIDADVICGGDPCQSRSLAKSGRQSRSPDLSGHFLALVGRSSARWVVRENVRSSDVGDFAFGLGLLGYGVAVVELDAVDFTAQSRRRQFVIGTPLDLRSRFERILSEPERDQGNGPESIEKRKDYASCVTARPDRFSEGENLVFEKGRGLRFLTCGECECLQGFPRGWTAGFSRTRRYMMIGNAVPPPMTEWIARKILTAAEGKV